MKKHNHYSLIYFFLFSTILVFLGSCVTQKQVKYLQRIQKKDTVSSYPNARTVDYKIQEHDNLYIRVFGLDEKTFLFFNKQAMTNNNSSYGGYAGNGEENAGLYLEAYVVDDSGYIDFPLVGKIFVKELKVVEAKTLIQSLVNEYLKDAMVTIKFVSFKITLLGEVRQPKGYWVYSDKFNVFEAISLAGDLTDFADRHKVAIIRQTKEGSRVIYINLNDINILKSPYFYLKPNDILYFAPLAIKRWGGTETFNWSLVFSAVSIVTSTILFINYFK